MTDEVKLIDAELLTTNIAQIAKNCAKSDVQKALIGRILFMIDNMSTIEAEPAKADWVQRGWEYFCSHCGGTAPMDTNRKHTVTTKFCPHCGYKMGG